MNTRGLCLYKIFLICMQVLWDNCFYLNKDVSKLKWTYWLWHYFTTISGHFFANYINIFHKTEVPTNILRCQLFLNLNLGQSISDVVKFSRFQTPTPLCWQSFKYYSLANLANFDPTPLRNDDVLNGWSLC